MLTRLVLSFARLGDGLCPVLGSLCAGVALLGLIPFAA